MINYAVILQSRNVLELAKDFVALMIIAEFDNMFAKYSEQMIVKDILDEHKADYKDLFKIETTTSSDRHGVINEVLPKDEIWDRIKERLDDEADDTELEKDELNKDELDEKVNKKNKSSSKTSCCRPKCCAPQRQRQKFVGIRAEERSWCLNRFLFAIYRLLRFIFVVIWFYYLPVIMMAFGYISLMWSNWKCRQDNHSGSRLIGGVCIDPITYIGRPEEF